LGVLLICYSVCALSRATPFPGVSALLPTLGSALIILFANQQNTVGKFVGNNALVGLGLVSYSAYLWHQPLFAFAKHGGFDNKDTIFISMNSMLVFILAFFTWKYVEVPFRKKRTLNQTKFFHHGLSFTAFFVIVGYYGH
jgi:peptidoglycan/LPS O-acetylase OafA/YrhL